MPSLTHYRRLSFVFTYNTTVCFLPQSCIRTACFIVLAECGGSQMTAAAGVITPWCLGGVFSSPAELSMPRTPAGPPRSHRTRGCPAGSTGRASRSHTAGCWCRLRASSYDPILTSYVALASSDGRTVSWSAPSFLSWSKAWICGQGCKDTAPPGFAPGKPCRFRDFAGLSFYCSPCVAWRTPPFAVAGLWLCNRRNISPGWNRV